MTIKRCYPVLIGASVTENQKAAELVSENYSYSNGVTISASGNVTTISFNSGGNKLMYDKRRYSGVVVPGNHVAYAKIVGLDSSSLSTNYMFGYTLPSSESSSTLEITTNRDWFLTRIRENGACGASIYFPQAVQGESITCRGFQLTDLTAKFGSSIADYVYSLEQQTAGSGIAWLRTYGFITDDYRPHNTGTIESVEATAKVVRDENNENAVTYPLGTDTLRGIFKLDANNKLYADGDRKKADGTITRYYGTRAYQEGDESLADAITDGTTTVYKLSTPTTETSTPFTSPQIVYPDGTEEFVTENGVPVGHETKYQL